MNPGHIEKDSYLDFSLIGGGDRESNLVYDIV